MYCWIIWLVSVCGAAGVDMFYYPVSAVHTPSVSAKQAGWGVLMRGEVALAQFSAIICIEGCLCAQRERGGSPTQTARD